MVYYYQIVTKPLTSEPLKDETCPVCSTKGSLQLTLYMRYISMLIPIYGMGRRTGVHCTACNHEIKNPDASIFAKKKYSDNIAIAIQNLRSTHKRTTWQLLYPWSFWFVLLIIIGGALISTRLQKNEVAKNKETLSHPQIGDIYKGSWERDGVQSASVLIKNVRMVGDTMFVVISKDYFNTNPYDKKEWAKLSPVFDNKEYKLRLSSFVSATDFFEYPNAENHNRLTYKGAVLGKGSMNLSFDVIERGK